MLILQLSVSVVLPLPVVISIAPISTNCGGANNATSNVVTLTVNPVPSTPTASNNGPLCFGATLNLTTPAVAGSHICMDRPEQLQLHPAESNDCWCDH